MLAVGRVKSTAEEVRKKWQAMKSAVKGKAAELNRERVKTGRGPGVEWEPFFNNCLLFVNK